MVSSQPHPPWGGVCRTPMAYGTVFIPQHLAHCQVFGQFDPVYRHGHPGLKALLAVISTAGLPCSVSMRRRSRDKNRASMESPVLQEKEIHQDSCLSIPQHFTYGRRIARHNAATSSHGLQQTPTEHKGHRDKGGRHCKREL